MPDSGGWVFCVFCFVFVFVIVPGASPSQAKGKLRGVEENHIHNYIKHGAHPATDQLHDLA